MSDYQQKELSGSLFKNGKKEKDTHPDVRGTAKIDGVDYRVSGWNRTTKSGAPWISLAFTRADTDPRQKQDTLMPAKAESEPEPEEPEPVKHDAERAKSMAKPRGTFAEMDDDIPF